MNNKINLAVQGASAGPWGALLGAKIGGMQDTLTDVEQALSQQQQALGQRDNKLSMDDDDMKFAQNFVNNSGYGGY